MKTNKMLCLAAALGLLVSALSACSWHNDKQKEEKLAATAKISGTEAERIALAKVPNGTIKEGEIEKEKGKLIWSFDIATPGTADITEVNVDANTGEIAGIEHEKAKDEKKEKD